MSTGYTLFDANHIRRAAHRRVRRLYGMVLGIILMSLLSVGLGRAGLLSTSSIVWALGACWLLAVGVVVWQIRRLRHTVWCVKVSPDALVGYDYTRHKTELAWPSIHRVDLTGDALVVVQSPHRFFEVSTSFPDYPVLSHQVVRLADDHGVPVCIEGQPWPQLDVYELYPFLTGEPPADAPGMTA